MRVLKSTIVLLAFALICGLSAQPRASEIIITDSTFTDTKRNRTIPYKLYAPQTIAAPAPVVIFSHGLGGSTEAAPYLGTALAEHGYLAFFIQHPGSDKSVWKAVKNPAAIKKELWASTKNPQNAVNRYKDLPFAIDGLERLNAAGPLKGKMDLEKIGMAGHSYGGRSVLMAAGEQAAMGHGSALYKETRIKAGLVLSPGLPERYSDPENADLTALYKDIAIPLFHMTGTEDGHPFREDFLPSYRTIPYKNIAAGNQYLLILDGATHATFGKRAAKDKKSDTDARKIVAEGAVLFFDAYLKGDAKALEQLRQGFAAALSPADKFEYK